MTPSAATTLGVITLDGQKYLERPHIYGIQVKVTQSYQVIANQSFTLPGVANFLLKGLSRVTITPRSLADTGGNVWAVDRLFRFRLTNQPGSTWYFSGGLGILHDWTYDRLCFGSGQFPYPLIPPIPLDASATLFYGVEDNFGYSIDTALDYPYTIHIALHGTHLIPVNDVAQPAG